jgi:hypothetical protein
VAGRHNATSVPVHDERLGSLKGSPALVSAETEPQSFEEGQGPLRRDLPLFGANYSKKTDSREPGAR